MVCSVQVYHAYDKALRTLKHQTLAAHTADEPRCFLSLGTSTAPVGSTALILPRVRPAKHDKR